MVKGDVEQDEEGMLRRIRVNTRICCSGRKVADLKIYLFSATKQDRMGPSLLSRNPMLTFCSLLYMYLSSQSVRMGTL